MDQIPDQIGALRFQFVIPASKWHNARARVGAGHFRHSFTLQARAIDNQSGGNSSLGGLKICTAVIRVNPLNYRAQKYLTSAGLEQFGEFSAHPPRNPQFLLKEHEYPRGN